MEGLTQPSVFLSSTFKDEFKGGRRSIPLRTRILEERDRLPVDLWAYEHVWPSKNEENKLDADTIIDRCFAGIKNCDLFVFILSGGFGTGAALVDERTHSSYLELELFAAAVLRKPILVLHYQGREPDPALVDVLKLLHRAFADGDYFIGNENDLFARFNAACRALAKKKPAVGRPVISLADALSRTRTRADLEADLDAPKLAFLSGELKVAHDLNLVRARALIDQVAAGVREVGGVRMTMPHGSALFRLWAAMRDLMTWNDDIANNDELAGLWDRALGLWAAKASWFGLHGHIWMGPLAAVNTQAAFRRQRGAETPGDPTIREPNGARASALYSVAQKVRSFDRKLFHLRQTSLLATRAAALDKDAHQGVLAIRGNASLAEFKMGLIWKLWDAERDFKTALSLRERAGASSASVGEMQVDLGLTQVLSGRGRQGAMLIVQGIAGLRTDNSANGRSFLARALRKQGFAARLMGRFELAADIAAEIAAIGAEVEAMDQLRDLPQRSEISR